MFCECGNYLSKTVCVKQVNQNPFEQEIAQVSEIHFRSSENKYLPEKHKENLIKAHNTGSQIIKNGGHEPEPFETALLVEEYRWFWKPKNVKFVLVAESHVYAGKEEISVEINPQKLRRYAPSYPQGGPLNFAKIVYCPGYGEPDILDSPEKIENNPGTKQFIDLFRKCLGYNKPTERSLEWKARILRAARDNGLWLLDASCHACAKGNKERLPKQIVDRIVPFSWKKYVEPIVDELEIDSEKVWIIGKGTHDLIRGKYATGNNWSYQPNVIVKKDTEMYEEKKRREQSLQKTVREALSM